LSQTDCFITHGGMNSVQEGLCSGVPLVVVPQQMEQQAVAERVADTRTGIYIRKVNVASLREAVREILQNGTYKANCLRLGASLKSAGGFSMAVDEILLFKQKSGIRGNT
jgi:UDP:flavonoid glycosyltransferase YjiC (YdhE family)